MIKGIFLLDGESYRHIYGPQEREAIARLVQIYAPPQTRQSVAQDPSVLADADVILSGWGMAVMDESFLAAAPKLKVIFYGAGTIKGFVTDAAWERGIVVTSAYAANAVPVAEYTLSQIFFCLKWGWHYVTRIKQDKRYPYPLEPPTGAYGSTVGIISLSMIGRRVVRLLQPFDLEILAYDPYVTPQEAEELNVTLCSLEDIFRRSDIVSLHAPWLPETEGMITGAHLATMKPKATFINTARGAIVREQEMIAVLQQRPDLYAILDVTYPEPPEPGSPLYTLPNVILTPHIAGSQGRECQRMGKLMVEELQRYLNNEPLQWAISRERLAVMA